MPLVFVARLCRSRGKAFDRLPEGCLRRRRRRESREGCGLAGGLTFACALRGHLQRRPLRSGGGFRDSAPTSACALGGCGGDPSTESRGFLGFFRPLRARWGRKQGEINIWGDLAVATQDVAWAERDGKGHSAKRTKTGAKFLPSRCRKTKQNGRFGRFCY